MSWLGVSPQTQRDTECLEMERKLRLYAEMQKAAQALLDCLDNLSAADFQVGRSRAERRELRYAIQQLERP